LSKKKIEQNSAPGVQEDVGEMKSELIGVPKEIVEDERDILNRAIVD
jgi:hypothetical protein